MPKTKELNEDKIKQEFLLIKANNPHKTLFPNNKNGGAGNTLEKLLKVKENNKKEADYENFEVKALRTISSANISLSSKVPTQFAQADNYLWNNFGNVNAQGLRRFYPTLVASGRWTVVYKKNLMRLELLRKEKKVRLLVADMNEKVFLDTIFWSFDDVYASTKKLGDMFLTECTEKKINNITYFNYNSAHIFWNFNFDNFLNELELGNIVLDFRCGVYKDEKRFGRMHDRGPAWRLRKNIWKDIMTRVTSKYIYVI